MCAFFACIVVLYVQHVFFLGREEEFFKSCFVKGLDHPLNSSFYLLILFC